MAKKITYNNDEGVKMTDELLEELEKKINKTYSQASKEVEEKLSEYLEKYETKNTIRLEYLDKQLDKYKAGEISWNEYKLAQNEYTQWRIGQVAIGERWEELRDSLSQDLANTSNICRSMTEGYMCEAYALNHNYGTYLVESASRVDTSYTLYNRSAVERLVRKEPQILPMMSDKTKQRILTQKLEVWNGQKLTSALTQGILQGESIPKIAERFRGVAEMDYKQSIRTARTSMTSAQNGGRLDSFNRASDMGLKMKKQWVATIDDRTRHEHRMLDGQKVELDEPFEVDGYELMYPADPSGEPEMVYNCRCAMISIFDGYDKSITDYDIDDRLGDMTYDEWKQSKNIKSEPIDKQEKQGKAIKQSYINQYKRMKNG
jgi:SPP1 gp7 family putative phage head morphogenesis protein